MHLLVGAKRKEVLVMSKAIATAKESVTETVSRLVDISKLDTLYRDLYLARARELMMSVLPNSNYTYTKENLASLGWVERQLKVAIDGGDWKRSHELTERARSIEGIAATSAEKMKLGEAVYDRLADIPIDPFVSGFHVFVEGSSQKLREWRAQAIATLSVLEQADLGEKDFYARRRADFQALKITMETGEESTATKTTDAPADLHQQALTALERRDLSQLDQVIQKLMEKSTAQEVQQESAEVRLGEAAQLGDDLLYSFSEATLAAASRFGLAPVRTQSRRQFAYLMQYGWQPSMLRTEGKEFARDQLAKHMHPGDTTDIRDAIELYLLHPFINSGGTRYLVCLVVEDLLLEDFAEPEPGEKLPSALLAALGLESRWGLSRIEIENALLLHGPRILEEELKLDPEAFRLIAIPPDIYLHLGPERGWGQHEMWTHFDGYRVRESGKLRALAGGDKRFSGIQDMISIDCAYASEKIIARFAVVQRKRMRSWQQT
jgi:hypothetical protein